MLNIRRNPQLLVFATIQPVIFVIMFRYVFGGAIRGYRATALTHDKRVRIVCQCPEAEWQALKPAFDKVMKEASRAKVILLDLRDTPSGGDSEFAKPLMAWFVTGLKPYQKHQRGRHAWLEQVQGRADAWHGRGIGRMLMQRIIACAKKRGLKRLEGVVLRANQGMLKFSELPYLP